MSAQRQGNTRNDLAVVPITEASEIDVAKVNELSQRLMPAFPNDCNPQQALEVARLAVAYGLDPFLKELIPYQGQPYITIAGMVRIADRHPMFDGMTDDIVYGERLKALQQTPNEIVWECTVYRKDRKMPVRAFGRAGGPYDERQAVAKARPFEMAQKRAIHRALRAAFPVPIPGLETSLTPEQLRAIHALDDDNGVTRHDRHETLIDTFGVESSKDLTRDQASAYIDGRQVQITEVVDRETGEIIETRLPDNPATNDDLDTNPYWAADRSLIRWPAAGDPSLDIADVQEAAKAAETATQITELWNFAKSLGLGEDGELKGYLAARRRELSGK